METIAKNKAKNTKSVFSNSYRTRKAATPAQSQAIATKREQLKELSQPLRELHRSGEIQTINEGLKSIYAKQGHTDLKTMREWNEAGYNVKKGEKALLLWGRKKTSQPREVEENQDPYKFHPICFVFSNQQVAQKQEIAA